MSIHGMMVQKLEITRLEPLRVQTPRWAVLWPETDMSWWPVTLGSPHLLGSSFQREPRTLCLKIRGRPDVGGAVCESKN